ncbi:MAG: biopolymer transporter ExbD [Acidobacteria bacterium]|nr:biopolymer transporter ExbD [Acidobacteriota bacterium]
MDLGGAKGGIKSDINVTPMADVMLVLLIIMMIVAPMLQKGVDVRLPEAGNTVDKPETQDQTVLAITADKRLYVNGVQVSEPDLMSRIQAALEDKKERIVLIKADTDAQYSTVMVVMDRLREAQIEDIGLITERKLLPGQTGG